MTNQAARFRIGEVAVDFFNRKPCVQWNYDYSEPGAGIDELDVIRLVGKKNGQPVSGFEALFRQCRSNAPDARIKFPESTWQLGLTSGCESSLDPPGGYPGGDKLSVRCNLLLCVKIFSFRT